jgi:hypothetical protein
MPDIGDCVDLSILASPLWKHCLLKHYGKKVIDVISTEGNRFHQRKKYGDYIVEFEENESIRFHTVETKTRSDKYHPYYLSDRLILFEIMGNYEKKDNGSSLYDCKADIWATAFYVNDSLKEPMLFWVKELKSYVRHWEHQGIYKYMMSNTNQYYQTRSVLVPFREIEKFQFKPFTRND